MVIGNFKKNSVCDRGTLDQINPPSQQILQPVKKTKVTIRCPSPSQLFESNKEIQIAGFRHKITSGGGPEEFKSNDAVLPAERFDRSAMFPDQFEHLRLIVSDWRLRCLI